MVMKKSSTFNITQGIQPAMSTISIPIRLVLSSISESEASGSALVSPVPQRRRPSHGLPIHHPHRRRKVSAPPELQSHFNGISPNAHHGVSVNVDHHHQNNGGANPNQSDTTSHKNEYIINLAPDKHLLGEGLYSGSDSGVPSEYSSWAIPVSGLHRPDTSSPDDDLTSPVGSIDDLVEHRPGLGHTTQPKYYTSDSECESIGMSSPPQRRRSTGMANIAYVNTEAHPMVVAVGAAPPLSRSNTDTNLRAPTPSPNASVHTARPRTNSMVLQLSLANQQNAGGLSPGIMHSTRSVSMVSLNTAGNNSTSTIPVSTYPNLASLASHDTQSIYSEVNPNHFNSNLKGIYHVPSMGSQGSLSGVGYKETDHNQSSNLNPNSNPDDGPESTSEERKYKWFIHTLSENCAIMYAVFIFMLAIVIYLADTFSGHDSAMAEGFNVFLIVVQLLWLGYVHVDVRRYLKTIGKAMGKARSNKDNKGDPIQLEPTSDGQYQLRINLPEPTVTIPQHYGFTSGRHGGSLYLKIGATVFCFGHLIHNGLNLGQKILYLTEEDPAFINCTCTPDVLMSVLQPIYAFYQLFFIFKYSNLIINRRKLLTRFALMHCIASSLCFWVYTILQETLQALFSKKSSYANSSKVLAPIYGGHSYGDTGGYGGGYGYNFNDDSDEMYDDDDDDDDDNAGAYGTGSSYNGQDLKGASAWTINYGCEKTTDLTKMINYTTPYLYPFSIEYNILIVGIWILLWENIGRIDRHTHIPSVEVTYEEDNTKAFSSNFIIYVDCHSSNRGLFAGLLVTVATVISIILFFIFASTEENKVLGIVLNGWSELILLMVMTISGILSLLTIRHLDVMKTMLSSVDDILLYICLPCIFLYAFFSMVPSIKVGGTLFVAVNLLQVVQTVIQTALIGDGLRRCSNSIELQQKKLGREVVTFLVVSNLALWLLMTFEIKSEDGNSDKYDYYGKYLWTIISHLTLPLALFYRFHSSVCLADMWKASYEPEEEH